MRPGHIRGANAVVKGDGALSGDLALCVTLDEKSTQYMTSAWYPTPYELMQLNAGQPVFVSLIGQTHPPLLVFIPED